jgi:hypothetical protein
VATNKRFKEWAAGEDEMIRKHYPAMAATGMLARGYLADRTREAINRRAYVLGVKFDKHTEKMDQFETPWPMPTMDLNESLDCIRLRNWRGPVSPGLVGGRIGL